MQSLRGRIKTQAPFVWFTLDEPSLDKRPDADSDGWNDGWGSYFGLDGFTQCSHMLIVTHRAAEWDPLAPHPKHDFMLYGVLALLVQA